MPADLRSITNFEELIAYLRDELDWPVEDYGLEDLTFEYDADELGLKEEEAEKLKDGTVRQLRPLPGGQPFGIFFVEFGQARLPVVVLRRILNALVLKKRNSANPADRQRWDAADILFISAFGESNDREIAFAHFHKDPDTSELPVLRVLGWHGSTPSLKTKYVAEVLKSRLTWPEDPSNHEAWRQKWSKAFRNRLGHEITTAKELALVLAQFAGRVRDAARTVMSYESESGKMRQLHNGFKEALIHDLSEDDFATYYAETICYGLFTVAVSKTELSEGKYGTAIATEDVAHFVPVTNPFLQKILWSFLDAGGRARNLNFDDLGINEVVTLLNGEETNLPAVLRDFGNVRPGEDPVIHLYEDFLKQFDADLRKKRGVYYTPIPVVSYIVRSVHELLQTEFGLTDGLADITTWGEMLKKHPDLKLPPLTDLPGEKAKISSEEAFVQILDPATGTATFLVEVISQIAVTMKSKWGTELGLNVPTTRNEIAAWNDPKVILLWNDYVPNHLLPRLHGYELMMAPYAIAHMKIGLKLAETGYNFATDERARIYLTNALEPWQQQLPLIGFDALAHEAAAVNEIKRHKRFTVVTGNPPYAGFSANEGEWIEHLMEDYKKTVRDEERQIQRLSNDYVKFIRFSEAVIRVSNVGCLGFITDSGYLNGILFRDMRTSLQSSFERAWILDLHGVAMRGADRHVGVDENVFDITQGVAIGLFVHSSATASEFKHADLIGSRQMKYLELSRTAASTTLWSRLKPMPPKCFFVPTTSDDNYERWPLFTEIIGTGSPKNDRDSLYGTGIKTRHDEFVVGWTPQDAVSRVKQVANRTESDGALINELGLCTTAHFSIREARRRAEASDLHKYVKPIAYRPFDWRSIVYLREFICEPKAETMRHMLHPQNIAMAVLRRDRKENGAGFFVARGLIAKDLVSNLDDALVWPLYLLHEENQLLWQVGRHVVGTANIARKIVTFTTTGLNLKWCEHGCGNLTSSVGPEDIFHYAYAVFHSPGYRSRYAEFLKDDFPHLPLTGNLDLFRALARLGGDLTALHLLESPTLDETITEFIGKNRQVSKVGWTPVDGGTVWLDCKGSGEKYKPGTSGFSPVPEDVWNFHIGGYQVCEKWLKDRGPKKGQSGRTLTAEDIAHYHKIVIALTETIRLMEEIDDVIETHGGWPGAFSK